MIVKDGKDGFRKFHLFIGNIFLSHIFTLPLHSKFKIMKNIILFFSMVLFSNLLHSQWVYKKIDNKIDVPYKIAYCSAKGNSGILKLENVEGEMAFYVMGSFFCDDYPTVDIGIVCGTETFRYSFNCAKSSDSSTIFILDDLKEEANQIFLGHFKKASSLSLRVNESHCTDEYYDFKMSGSTAAFDFMSK